MHRVVNYGSVLQALSLREMIRQATGDEASFVEIHNRNLLPCRQLIRYEMDYQEKPYAPHSLFEKGKRKIFRRIRKRCEDQIRSFAADQFGSGEQDSGEAYDCVVIGSDEVFNTAHGVNLQLYGGVENTKRVISYAASCGSATIEEIPQDLIPMISECVGKFYAMSVRDAGTQDYMRHFYSGEIAHHLDPVLVGPLRNRKPQPVSMKHFLIVYAYNGRIRNESEIRAIREFARKHHLKTVAVGGLQLWCDRYIAADPGSVLDYFAAADYVVTDTFHGTIFSVINRKQFVSIERPTNRNKMTHLLGDLHLSDRMLSDVQNLETLLTEKIDYQPVFQILEQESPKAIGYLRENLTVGEAI